MNSKIRYIILPFFIGSLLLSGGYAAVRLVVDIYLRVGNITRELWELWIPIILAVVFSFAVMRGRFRLIGASVKNRKAGKKQASQRMIEEKAKRKREFLHWSVAIAIMITMIGSQKYISSSNRELIPVDSLEQIGHPKPDACFTISQGIRFVIGQAALLPESRRIPKRYGSSELDLIIYCAVPMTGQKSFPMVFEPIPGRPDHYSVLPSPGPYTYWYVKKYKRRVKNQSDSNIERTQRELYNEVETDLTSGRLEKFNHLRVEPYSDDYRSMLRAVEMSRAKAVSEAVILIPEESPFQKSDAGLQWALGSLAFALALVTLVAFASPEIPEKQIGVFIARAKLSLRERFDLQQLATAFPKMPGVTTYVLIGVNCAFFIITLAAGVNPITPSPYELFEFGGATIRDVVDEGEWWRIFTSMFLHGSAFHLATNMFILFLTGWLAEGVINPGKYLFVYLASGIGAFLLASCFLDSGTVLVGASGAIFGIMGVLLAIYVRNPKKHTDFLWIFLCFGGMNLLYGLLPGISNSGHIGGLATGFVLGLFLYRPRRKRHRKATKSKPQPLTA